MSGDPSPPPKVSPVEAGRLGAMKRWHPEQILSDPSVAEPEPYQPDFSKPPEVSFLKLAEMVSAQGGKCAICLVEFKDRSEVQTDHNHSTGALRGLLCRRCNSWIVAALESKWARPAAEYLKKYGSEEMDYSLPDEIQYRAENARAYSEAVRAVKQGLREYGSEKGNSV